MRSSIEVSLQPERARRRRRGCLALIGTVGLLTALTHASVASAESGVASCRPTELREVFAGAPGCEDAAYVMLELQPYSPNEFWNHPSSVTLYLESSDDWQYMDLEELVSPDVGAGARPQN